MTPELCVAVSKGPVRGVKGSPPVTASHGYVAGSVTMRATTTVAVSLAPRTTPQAIATPGAAKASDMAWTSPGVYAPCPAAPEARTSPTSRSAALKPQRLPTEGMVTSAIGLLTRDPPDASPRAPLARPRQSEERRLHP